jgi:RNA polymerase sigma-70 factor (ECF subfamily)
MGPQTPTGTSHDAEAERALVERLRKGDEAAFETLVRTHGPRMLAVASRFLRQPADAEDVLQEAFTNALRAIGSFQGDSRLGTWLHRITVNCALMRLRAKSRRPEALGPPEVVAAEREARAVSAPWALSAVEVVERAELREAVLAALDALPELDRALVRLHDIQGMTLQDVSRTLDLGLTTVKERLHRARHALRRSLGPLFSEARP